MILQRDYAGVLITEGIKVCVIIPTCNIIISHAINDVNDVKLFQVIMLENFRTLY